MMLQKLTMMSLVKRLHIHSYVMLFWNIGASIIFLRWGGKVVYKGEAGLNGLFEIERLTKTGKPKTVKTERFGNFPCRYCEVQHATDSEIKAGRRL